MKWLWQEYKPDNTYRVSSAPASPYEEAQGVGSDETRYINPIVRFWPVFRPICRPGLDGAEISPPDVENIFFHILAASDRQIGLRQESLERHRLKADLTGGLYGKKAQKLFDGLDETDQEYVLGFLRRQQEEGSRRLLFLECLQALFPQCAAYYYRPEDTFLFYIASPETEENKNKVALLEELFWDVACRNRKYYWNEHFGIIGQPPTMRIGRIKIY